MSVADALLPLMTPEEKSELFKVTGKSAEHLTIQDIKNFFRYQSNMHEDQEKKKLKVEEAKERTRSKSLWKLWESGIPDYPFMRVASKTFKQVTKKIYKSAKFVEIDHFKILSCIENQVVSDEERSYTLFFIDEKIMELFMKYVMYDLMKICKVWDKSFILNEVIFKVEKSNTFKHDIWMVEVLNKPNFIIKLECQNTWTTMMDSDSDIDISISSELFDYLAYMSYYIGSRSIGIITTGAKWRIIWLSNEQDLVSCQDIDNLPLPLPCDCNPKKRIVYSSPCFDHADPMLLKYLASLLLKCVHAQTIPVSLFTKTRYFIIFDDKTWHWKQLQLHRTSPNQRQRQHQNLHLNLNFTVSSKRKNHCAIRFFTNDVLLALVPNQGGLYVIKRFENGDHAIQEGNRWLDIWGVNVRHFVVQDRPSIALPFAIACKNLETQPPVFNVDLVDVLVPHAASLDPNDRELLAPIAADLTGLASAWTPFTTLKAAVHDMASKGYSHDDIEWRHVALLPCYTDNALTSMRPIFIDLERVTKHASPQAAMTAMKANISHLLIEARSDISFESLFF